MPHPMRALLAALLLVSCRSAPSGPPDVPRSADVLSLDGEWLLEGLPPDVDASGAAHVPQDPISAQVPGTVQAALLAAGRITDPYAGTQNETSQWVRERAWWVRRAFALPERFRGKDVRLRFEGVACASTVWLNGRKIGEMSGMHARASFDVSAALHAEGTNTLVVRIPPLPPDGALAGVCRMSAGCDFAPRLVPMGIWRSVSLSAGGRQWIESPSVETDEVAADGTADLTLRVTLVNAEAEARAVTLRGEVPGTAARFAKQFDLGPLAVEDAVVAFRLPDARRWWPNGMGEPDLYRLDLALEPRPGAPPASPAAPRASTLFGVRRIRLEKNDAAAEGDAPWTFVVNGRRTYVTGATWVPADALYRHSRERIERLVRLARDAGLKLLRVWGGGVLESDDFYDLCDRYGILVWQEFPLVGAEDRSGIPRKAFLDAAASHVLRLRGHPSLALWAGGAEVDPDGPSTRDLIDGLAGVLRRLDPARPFRRSSPSPGEERNGSVWRGPRTYAEHRRPVGFRSEAGMPSPPSLAALKRFLPAERLWPPQEAHAYRGLTAPASRCAGEYGAPRGAADWVRKLQLAQAIAVQFNVETCRAQKYANSGVLPSRWNEPWPCVSSSLIDWAGEPKPAYYYYKRACEPVRVTADFTTYAWRAGETFRAEVVVVNDRSEALAGLRAAADVVDREGRVRASRTFELAVAADAVARPGAIAWVLPPDPAAVPGRVFFLRLRLTDARGAEISRNLFWHGLAALGSKDRREDGAAGGPIPRPSDAPAAPEHEDLFAGLSDLAPAVVRSWAVRAPRGARTHRWLVRLENLSRGPAFQVALRADGVPPGWTPSFSDNAFTLWGGERRDILAELLPPGAPSTPGEAPSRIDLRVSGWNVPDQAVAP